MDEEDIKFLNEWFDKKEQESSVYSSYHHTEHEDGEDIYVVIKSDVEEFMDFLNDNWVDMVGIKCTIGSDGIWFTSEDFRDADWR